MRHDLNGLAQVVTTALTLDYVLVDFACGNIVVAAEGHVKITLIVAQVEISLAAIVEDIYLT